MKKKEWEPYRNKFIYVMRTNMARFMKEVGIEDSHFPPVIDMENIRVKKYLPNNKDELLNKILYLLPKKEKRLRMANEGLEIVKKYEQLNLPMNLGDILFFDPHLFHRSGTNVSKEVRFSLVGMWNDCTHEKFKAPLPNFIPRTITEKEYFKKIMQKKSN